MSVTRIDPNATYGEINTANDWEQQRSSPYWEYRRKWEEYPKNQIVSDFPIHLDIETTNGCNLQCPMCPRTVLLQKNSFYKIQFMDFGFYRHLIDQGADRGLCSVKLNYLGEPLLHPDVVKQVRYAKKRGIIDVMFNTNGTLLTEDLSRQLLDAGLDKIFFSFDSHLKDEYESIRIGADFEKTVDNIKTFVRLKNSGGYGSVETRISMVLRKDEHFKFLALKEMWKDIVDSVGYGYYIERDPEKQMCHPPVKGFICAQPWQRIFVLVDGTVTPCCVDERQGYILGDAGKQDLKDIWLGIRARALRKAHQKGRYQEIGICRRCYIPLTQEAEGNEDN